MTERDFNKHNLRRFLVDYFSEDDIRDICFNLNLDFESLPGQGKPGKARELIIHCEHRGLFEELKKKVHQTRPDDLIQNFLENESETTHNQIKSTIDKAKSFQNIAQTIDLLFINEDEGVFELEEIWVSKFREVTKITGKLTGFFRTYNQELTKLSEEIDSLKRSKQHPSKNDFKKLYNKQALILDNFAEQLSKETHSFEKLFSEGLLAFLRESSIHIIDFKKPGKTRVEFMVSKLRELALSSRAAFHADQMMINSIQNIPRTISSLVKAKKRLW